MQNKDKLITLIYEILICGIIGVIIFASLTIGTNNKNEIKNIHIMQKELLYKIAQINVDLQVLEGKLQIYENLPIDMSSRIEILEMRYDNLIIFQDEIKRKPKPPTNSEIVK